MAFAELLEDIFPGYMFVVRINGLQATAFTKVSGLGATIRHFEYPELGSAISLKFPEKIIYKDIVLQRGQISDFGIYALLELTQNSITGHKERFSLNQFSEMLNQSKVDLTIEQRNYSGAGIRKWRINKASLKDWEIGELDAMKSTFAVEKLVLTHHGLTIVK